MDQARDAVAGRLAAVLDSLPCRFRMTAAWLRLRRRVARLRVHDELTGLLTHRSLVARGAKRVRRQRGGALLRVDVDRLADVNSTLGRAAGDACLVEIAGVLRRLAAGALVARRGDEFIVLVADAAQADALAQGVRAAIATRFCAERTRVRRARPDAADRPTLTLSIGAAAATTGDGLTRLLQRADAALEEARRAGRDGVRWAPDVPPR